MKLKKISLALILATSVALPSVFADDATPPPPPAAGPTPPPSGPAAFNPAQTAAIGKIAGEYIVAHPEVLIQASKALQQKEMAAQEQHATEAVGKNTNDIFFSKGSPVIGNPKGDITLIEFYDYQCGHCKQMSPTVDQLIKDNPNLKVIFKEFPIFGGASDIAAKAALAVYLMNPDKYLAFHHALMAAKTPLSEDAIYKIATDQGIDLDKLKTQMKSDAVKSELEKTVKLAQQLGIMGTPYLIVGKSTGANIAAIPGAAPAQAIQQKIDALKAK